MKTFIIIVVLLVLVTAGIYFTHKDPPHVENNTYVRPEPDKQKLPPEYYNKPCFNDDLIEVECKG